MALIVKVFAHNFLFLRHFRQSTKIDSYPMENSQCLSIIYSTQKLVHVFSHLHVLASKEIELKKTQKKVIGHCFGCPFHRMLVNYVMLYLHETFISLALSMKSLFEVLFLNKFQNQSHHNLENFHHQMEKHDILLFKMETPFQLNRMSC